MKTLMCSYADKKYFTYLKVLMKSAVMYVPEANYHCALINCKEAQHKEITDLSPKMTIDYHRGYYPNKQVCHSYMFRYRLDFILGIFRNLAESYDVILFLDADTIIRRHDKEFIPFLHSCDLAMRVKDYQPDFMDRKEIGFSGSSFVLRCQLKVIKFWFDFKEGIANDYRWMASQYGLTPAFNKNREFLNFKAIPRKFCNPWHEKDAVIWEGNGNKKRQPEYVAEMKRIINA